MSLLKTNISNVDTCKMLMAHILFLWLSDPHKFLAYNLDSISFYNTKKKHKILVAVVVVVGFCIALLSKAALMQKHLLLHLPKFI